MKKIKIDIPHFYCLEYTEGNKTLKMEIDFRESKIMIGKSLIKKWEKPYESEAISEGKREEIYKNVKDYLIKRWGLENLIEFD